MSYDSGYQPFIFNSAWPSLQIAFEDVVTISAGTSVTIAHGLGFPPLTMVWKIVGGVSVGRVFYNPPTNTVSIDATNIIITGAVDANVSYSIKCYNLDISRSVAYTAPNATTSTVGYTIPASTIDLRDCIFHTRCQSPAVLAVVAGTKNGGSVAVSYTNPAGYTPWVLGFVSNGTDNTKYKCFAPENQTTPGFFQIGTTSTVWCPTNGGIYSMVVLRDPLVIANEVEVAY